MGEGQYGSTPPFFNLRKSPQEMTHTQREEGAGPQVLRPGWLGSTHSEGEGHRKLGTEQGSAMVQQSQEERFLFLLTISKTGELREEGQHVPHLIRCS